jgi:hypothetical protein
MSRRDCELACDEYALEKLGENELIPYGKTLLAVVEQSSSPVHLMQTATSMNETKKQLTERVNLIVKKPKVFLTAAICVILICVIAAGCAFMGNNQNQSEEPDPTDTSFSDYSFTYEEFLVGIPNHSDMNMDEPIIIRSRQELEEFYTKHADILRLDNVWGNWDQITAKHDDTFFKNHTIILALGPSCPSSCSFLVRSVSKDSQGWVTIDIMDTTLFADLDEKVIAHTADSTHRLFLIEVDAVCDQAVRCRILNTNRKNQCTTPISFQSIEECPVSWPAVQDIASTQYYNLFRSAEDLTTWLQKYYTNSSWIPETFSKYTEAFFHGKTLACLYIGNQYRITEHLVASVTQNALGDVHVTVCIGNQGEFDEERRAKVIFIELDCVVPEGATMFLDYQPAGEQPEQAPVLSHSFIAKHARISLPDDQSSVIFTSASDLVEFQTVFANESICSRFQEYTAKYDNEFFRDHTLILARGPNSSSSIVYKVGSVTENENGMVTIEIVDMMERYDPIDGGFFANGDHVPNLFFIEVKGLLNKETHCQIVTTDRMTQCKTPVLYKGIASTAIEWPTVSFYRDFYFKTFTSQQQLNTWISESYPDNTKIPDALTSYEDTFFKNRMLVAVFCKINQAETKFSIQSACTNTLGDVLINIETSPSGDTSTAEPQNHMILVEIHSTFTPSGRYYVQVFDQYQTTIYPNRPHAPSSGSAPDINHELLQFGVDSGNPHGQEYKPIVIRSSEDLNDYYNAYAATFRLEYRQDYPSFVSKYTDRYFADHSLVIFATAPGTSGIHYQLVNAKYPSDKEMVINLTSTGKAYPPPETGCWLLFLEVNGVLESDTACEIVITPKE